MKTKQTPGGKVTYQPINWLFCQHNGQTMYVWIWIQIHTHLHISYIIIYTKCLIDLALCRYSLKPYFGRPGWLALKKFVKNATCPPVSHQSFSASLTSCALCTQLLIFPTVFLLIPCPLIPSHLLAYAFSCK